VRPWSYRNDISKGYEFSLNATLTRDWRSRLTFGTQKTIVSAAYDDWVEYFAVSRPLWERFATTPMLNPSTNYRTVADAIVLADTRLRDARAVNGVQPTDQRTRNASFNTNYTFSSGVLKALRIGAGCQWSSPNILGYARDANGNLNTAKPYRGAERFSTDASLGYPLKLLKGRVTWDVQLNLYNLLNENPLFARQAVDDGRGSPLVVRRYTQTPFYAQLTNTFSF
jgi:hypothetical protein